METESAQPNETDYMFVSHDSPSLKIGFRDADGKKHTFIFEGRVLRLKGDLGAQFLHHFKTGSHQLRKFIKYVDRAQAEELVRQHQAARQPAAHKGAFHSAAGHSNLVKHLEDRAMAVDENTDTPEKLSEFTRELGQDSMLLQEAVKQETMNRDTTASQGKPMTETPAQPIAPVEPPAPPVDPANVALRFGKA